MSSTAAAAFPRFWRARTVPCIVKSAVYAPVRSKTFDVKDPHAPSNIVHPVSAITTDDVPQIAQAAAQAQKLWKTTPLAERQAIWHKAAGLIDKHRDELVDIEHSETTSSVPWSSIDWNFAADELRETANVATVGLRGSTFHSGGSSAYMERVPYGVVLGIAPWNSPANLAMRSISAPLMAGNSAILRTSEHSPRTHVAVAELLIEAGLPEGVLSVVHVAPQDMPEVTEALIASPEIRKLNFTGSTSVGSKIAQVAGKHLVPSCMELGGKAPTIVLPSADLELAANNIIFGFTLHSGQICMATNTVLVHESIADEFMATLTKYTKELEAGAEHPMRRGLFTEGSAERARSLLSDALSKGAKVVTGQPQAEQGNVFQPTVVDSLSPDMRIFSEEHFAPLLNIIRYSSTEKAIEIANSSEYGLAASVFGQPGEATEVMKHLEAGQVHCNGPTIHDLKQLVSTLFAVAVSLCSQTRYQSQKPHGGSKQSGWGRFNSIAGLQEFSETRTFTYDAPHYYPH